MLWARTRIEDLMAQDYAGVQNGNAKPEVKDAITNLGIEYRLLTQFTSFVAVEERIVTDGGQPRRIEVPVEMPEGVSREGVFGVDGVDAQSVQSLPINGRRTTNYAMLSAGAAVVNGIGGGYGSGNGTGRGNGNGAVQATVEVTSGRRNERKSRKTANAPVIVPKPAPSTNSDDEVIRVDGVESDSIIVSQSIKATTLPKPEYPQDAKTNGAINVEVMLDAAGNVASAKAVSGDQAFYQASETAAKNAKFEIPKLSVEIAKITGVIAYNFAKDKTVTVAPELQSVRVEIKPNKYHSSVKALVERLKNNQTKATADEAKFVKDGKAEISVRVKELKPETVAELKKIGFEIVTEMISANAVVGRIAVEKIASLAELDAVTFVSPQNR